MSKRRGNILSLQDYFDKEEETTLLCLCERSEAISNK